MSQLAARHLVAALQRDTSGADDQAEGHLVGGQERSQAKSVDQPLLNQSPFTATEQEDTPPADGLSAPSFTVFSKSAPLSMQPQGALSQPASADLPVTKVQAGKRPVSAHPRSHHTHQHTATAQLAARPASGMQANREGMHDLPAKQDESDTAHYQHHHGMYSTLRISVDPESATASLDVWPPPAAATEVNNMPSAFAFPAMPFAGAAASQSGSLTHSGHVSHSQSLAHSVTLDTGSGIIARPASAPPLPLSPHFIAHRRQRQRQAPSRTWAQFSGSASNFLTPSLTEDHFLELQEGASEGGDGAAREETSLTTSGALQPASASYRASAFALTPIQQQRQQGHSSSTSPPSLQPGYTSSRPVSAQAYSTGGGPPATPALPQALATAGGSRQPQELDPEGLPIESKVGHQICQAMLKTLRLVPNLILTTHMYGP
jgi:hypothetical protein